MSIFYLGFFVLYLPSILQDTVTVYVFTDLYRLYQNIEY